MASEGEDQNIHSSNNIDQQTDIFKQLDEQLEELDDEEFHLPPISELPTLESILNETEDDPGSISDGEINIAPPTTRLKTQTNFSSDCGDTLSLHSRGSSESRSRTSDHTHRSRPDGSIKTHGSILRHVILKGVAAQLVSYHDRVGAGLPTTMAVGDVICVGTSHGLVLVFEPTQALKWCLGSTQLGDQYGSVSSLALSHDCTRLLTGFAKGQICLFDLLTGKLSQTIVEAHTPFTAVLHMKWTDYPRLAVISDSGGSVFELSVKRTMGLNTNETRCIFSGSRGEVCTVEPLIMSQFQSTSSIDSVIVAMATISKVIIVSLRPQLKVLFSHPLKASATTLPLLAWQFVVIQMPNGNKVIDPVLAFGREHTIYFYQLTHGSKEDLQFIPLHKMTVLYDLQGLSWLNTRTLAVMDVQERVHVIDVKTQDELDIVDLAHLGLVYASQHYKAIATGGNVSRAMALAGERSCYHSMVSFGAQILLLGTKSFQVMTMRSWIDRIDHLVRGKHLREALQLALDIYESKAQAVVNLTNKKEKRQQLVQAKILELLNMYLNKALTERPSPTNPTIFTNYYQQVIPLCVKVAVGARLYQLLFSHIWDMFSEHSISKGIFLESIEPYILDDQLPDMSPSITQCLLSHCEAQQRLQAAEACIVHLSVTSLDLHQTMTMCWAHALYDAIFYVYTHGMKDYITPLDELLTLLKNALDSRSILTNAQVSLGNKILVYISCCLAGRAYPHGNIDDIELLQVKHEIFKCITSLHTKNALSSEQPYPFLRTLLRFDTREFLNVLALAFEEAEFTSELGMIQRQRVVDILLQVMVEGGGFTPAQLGSLFTFIARQMSRQQGAIAINRRLFEQVLNHLTASETEGHLEERQTAMLELLTEGGLSYYNQQDLLNKANNAKFYRVCEFVYEQSGEHERILECYIKDPVRKVQVFSYMTKILTSQHYTDLHAQKLCDQIVTEIESLLELDNMKLANMLLTQPQLFHLIPQICDKLRPNPQLLFLALHAIFNCRSSFLPSSSSSMTPVSKLLSNELNISPTNNRQFPDMSRTVTPNEEKIDELLYPELQEEYIELMCSRNPNHVYSYLKNNDGYRLNTTLLICRRHKQLDAIALLLEKMGDIKGSFNILKSILQEKIDKLVMSVTEGCDSSEASLLLGHVQTQVVKVVRVCQLGSGQMDDTRRRDLWFPLLDILLAMQPPLNVNISLAQEVRGIVGHVVNSTMTHISLPAILERIMQDPGYCNCDFGQIKHLLKGMVERYTYEEPLYSTVVNILRCDQLKYLTTQKIQGAAPLVICSTSCAICHRSYHPSNQALAFSCGHSYHSHCGGESTTCYLCTADSGSPQLESSVQSIEDETTTVSQQPEEHTSKMNETQLDGVKRISVLDTGDARYAFMEDMVDDNIIRFNHGTTIGRREAKLKNCSVGSYNYWDSQKFALKLTPPTINFDLDDV